MGKKRQKKKNSDLSISSYSEQSSRNSSFSSFNIINSSVNEESNIPEKLLVTSVDSAECSFYAKCLKSAWEDVVFLHPTIIRAYNIEDLVLVKGEERTLLFVAHPLEKLRRNFIIFPKRKCPFRYQELVSLGPYERKVRDADEILVTYELEIENTVKNMSDYILRLLIHKYIYEGMDVRWKLFGKEYKCTIKSISSALDISNLSLYTSVTTDIPQFYQTTYKTVLITEQKTVQKSSALDHIGGLEEQIKLINRHMKLFLKTDICTSSVYCGTLLFTGPSGTGKSLLLEAIVKEYSIFTENITWYQLCAMSSSEIKKELKNIFQRAKDKAPSIITIDDVNYLCPKNAEGIHQCILNSILPLLETLDDSKVLIVATTKDSDYNTSVLQTSRRIMETIKFQIPSTDERVDILKKLLNSINHELTYEQIQDCAEIAHGFTGKDLLGSIKDAQMIVCKREFSDILNSKDFLNIVRDRGIGNIKYSDLQYSLKLKKPSIISSDIKVKKVHWSDIGGMSGVKEKLKELVELPLKFPDAFKHFNVSPSRGVLMYGPPGCSKTMIAKALATECELNFISKNASDLFDKYVGESEKAVRDLFAMAKAKSPCIIFLDEIDALVAERGSSSGSSGVGDRIVTTLLTEMDGVEELKGVIIIAATNRPDMLDDALVRNGRINHFIYVPLPDVETREEILKISMRKRLISEDIDFKALAAKTEGYSGAEIVNICNEAAFQLLAEDPEAQSLVFYPHHFDKALKSVLPRTSKEMLKFYEKFNGKYCSK